MISEFLFFFYINPFLRVRGLTYIYIIIPEIEYLERVVFSMGSKIIITSILTISLYFILFLLCVVHIDMNILRSVFFYIFIY